MAPLMNGLFPYWLESIAILCCFKTANEIASLAPSVVSHWSQSVASIPGGENNKINVLPYEGIYFHIIFTFYGGTVNDYLYID